MTLRWRAVAWSGVWSSGSNCTSSRGIGAKASADGNEGDAERPRCLRLQCRASAPGCPENTASESGPAPVAEADGACCHCCCCPSSAHVLGEKLPLKRRLQFRGEDMEREREMLPDINGVRNGTFTPALMELNLLKGWSVSA